VGSCIHAPTEISLARTTRAALHALAATIAAHATPARRLTRRLIIGNPAKL
jgi:hypothetical protein